MKKGSPVGAKWVSVASCGVNVGFLCLSEIPNPTRPSGHRGIVLRMMKSSWLDE